MAIFLLLVALLLRILHLRSLWDSVLLQVPILDAGIYDAWAREIASGQILARTPYFMGPLFAHLLAVPYALFGPGAGTALAIQTVLGMATLAGAWMLTRGLFGRGAALAALAVGALYAPFIHAESFILMTPLIGLIAVASALLAVRAARSGHLRDALVAGLAMGAGGAARADFLIAVPLVALGLARSVARTGRARVVAVLAAGVVVALVPVIVANATSGERGVLLTWNGGWNFFVGNHDGATGIYAQPDGIDAETDFTGAEYAMRLSGRAMGPAEVSRFYMGRGLDFMRENPGRFAALVVKRFGLFFTASEIPQNDSFDFMRGRSPVLRAVPLGFGLMAPLALVGMLLARRRAAAAHLPALMALAPLLAGMLFFVTGRFRLPVVPLLLPYAGLATASAVEAARRRAWPRLSRGVGAAAALAVVIHVLPSGFYRESAMALEYVHEGLRHERRGESTQAMEAFRRAIEADSRATGPLAMAYHNLAAVQVRSGALASAIPLYEKAVELDPKNAVTLYNLGAVQGRVGNHWGAVEALQKAVALRPDWADALCDLGAAYANSGRMADAEAAWRRALRARPNDPRALDALRRIGVSP